MRRATFLITRAVCERTCMECMPISQQFHMYRTIPRYLHSIVHPGMSGYLLESFVEPVDESLICRICRGVLNSPRKTPCGHVFCLSCLSSWIEYYGVCPNRCGDVELIEITHAVDIERCVFDLLKRCKYSSIGCKKQSKLSEIEQHERVCTYQHCGSKKPQQPNQEDMRRAAAPSLDCLFGRFGKAKKRPIPSTKPDNGHKVGFSRVSCCIIKITY